MAGAETAQALSGGDLRAFKAFEPTPKGLLAPECARASHWRSQRGRSLACLNVEMEILLLRINAKGRN